MVLAVANNHGAGMSVVPQANSVFNPGMLPIGFVRVSFELDGQIISLFRDCSEIIAYSESAFVGASERFSKSVVSKIGIEGDFYAVEKISASAVRLHGVRKDVQSATLRAAHLAAGRPQHASWDLVLRDGILDLAD